MSPTGGRPCSLIVEESLDLLQPSRIGEHLLDSDWRPSEIFNEEYVLLLAVLREARPNGVPDICLVLEHLILWLAQNGSRHLLDVDCPQHRVADRGVVPLSWTRQVGD